MDTYYFNKNRYFPESHIDFPGIWAQLRLLAYGILFCLDHWQQNIILAYKKHIPTKTQEYIRIAFLIFRIALIALVMNL